MNKRNKLITLKASGEEIKKLKKASKEHGVSVSELIRNYGITKITNNGK